MHRVRARIPEPLWEAAVKMAGLYGVRRTAKSLPVDYGSLKKRVERAVDTGKCDKKHAKRQANVVRDANAGSAADNNSSNTVATFLELDASDFHGNFHDDSREGCCECVLELNSGGGTKMRVCLKGFAAGDVATIGRSLWQGEDS